MKEELEPWSATQRSLPILVGVVWIVVGVSVLALGLPDVSERWEFLPWGVAMTLAGLFVLYVRLAVIPSVRRAGRSATEN